ncbi:MAG: hypothetical protein KC613_00910 [Myxococcales bacterium]|nr:hypothetical protein [Myxococcales bacterium]
MPRSVLRLALLAASLAATACGGAPDDHRTLSREEADAIRQRARQATDGDREMGGEAVPPPVARQEAPPGDPPPEAPPEPTTLPEAPPGHLVGDGFGPGQREAVLDARKAVAEQIVASVKAQTDTRSSEENGKGDQATSVKVQTSTAFDHLELIKTLGVVRRGGADFVARAALDRAAAIDVYSREIDQGRRDLEALVPVVQQGIAEHDTSVLLRTDRSPSHLLAEQRRRARIIEALGGSPPALAPAGLEALRKPATAARARAVVRVKVEGATPGLQRAVLAQVSKHLSERGCRVVEQGHGLTKGGVPVADATLTVASRTHRERDLDWVYVGFELAMKDARNGQGVFRHAALPSLAHGGGVNPAAAEAAAVRAFKLKLKATADDAFRGLTCQ